MATTSSESDVFVPLRGGATVRHSVLLWLLEAEDRGVRFTTEPDGRVRMSPPDRVRDTDRTFAHAHRHEVRAAVSYIERMLVEAPL
jgi:hypothetical protein